MKRKVIVLHLEEILILENGRRGNDGAENVILTSLVWPRPMIELRTAAKSVRLDDGERARFSDKPFHERVLFKEIVGGLFGVTVEVTERKDPTAIAEFLSSIAGNLVNAAFPLPPATETFRRIVHAGVAGLAARAQSGARDSIVRIAFGHGQIDPEKSGPGSLEIALTAPETLGAPDPKSKRPPLLTKGQPNGQAMIRYVIEED